MSNATVISNDVLIKAWLNLIEQNLNEESRWSQILLVAIMLLIFVVGLVGNLLTCVVIYCDKTMHTATNYYLFNLAISDLIVTFAILLDVNERLSQSEVSVQYNFGRLACKIHFFSVVTLWNNGILIMTALAIERYMAICHPLTLKSTPVWRRVMKIIAIIWIVAIAETLPELWTVDFIKSRKSAMCFTVPTPTARIINGISALVTFIIPLGIMIFVYTMIAFRVNVSHENRSNDRIFNHRDNRKKVNKLIALTLSFLVCWLPFFILRVLVFACDTLQLLRISKLQWWSIGYRITSLNGWFSAVLNPLLFSLMSTKFRKALKTLWNTKVKRQRLIYTPPVV